jgi:uncharacterized Zn finger protein (UPF0148 family)
MERCPDCKLLLVEDDDGLFCAGCGWEEPLIEEPDYVEEGDFRDDWDNGFDDPWGPEFDDFN